MVDLYGYDIAELEVGMRAAFSRTVNEADIAMFAGVSGDTNPVHLDEDFAKGTMFKGRIAHGMLGAAMISTVLGTKLPGPGCVYLSQTLKFLAPVRIGDTLVAEVNVSDINREKRRVTMSCVCRVGKQKVIEGDAMVMIPKRVVAETGEGAANASLNGKPNHNPAAGGVDAPPPSH